MTNINSTIKNQIVGTLISLRESYRQQYTLYCETHKNNGPTLSGKQLTRAKYYQSHPWLWCQECDQEKFELSSCEWQQDCNEDFDVIWFTGCSDAFQYLPEIEDPKTIGYIYCPNCGRKIQYR